MVKIIIAIIAVMVTGCATEEASREWDSVVLISNIDRDPFVIFDPKGDTLFLRTKSTYTYYSPEPVTKKSCAFVVDSGGVETRITIDFDAKNTHMVAWYDDVGRVSRGQHIRYHAVADR